MNRLICFTLVSSALVYSLPSLSASLTFIDPSPNAPQTSFLNAVSAKGEYAVGGIGSVRGSFQGFEAFRWSRTRGVELLGDDLNDFELSSNATAVNQDGSKIVGTSTTEISNTSSFMGSEATLWNVNSSGQSQPTYLGIGSDPRQTSSFAMTISGKGGLIGGMTSINLMPNGGAGFQAVAWFTTPLLQQLGFSPYWKGLPFGRVSAVNTLGTLLFGTELIPGTGQNAVCPTPVRYVQDRAIPIFNPAICGEITAAAGSGRYAFGGLQSGQARYQMARISTDTSQVEWLRTTRGATFSGVIKASNYLGNVVVGQSAVPNSKAFIWRQSIGAMDVNDFVRTELGIQASGWDFRSANGVSADGRVIVGDALNSMGQWRGWILNLSE